MEQIKKLKNFLFCPHVALLQTLRGNSDEMS